MSTRLFDRTFLQAAITLSGSLAILACSSMSLPPLTAPFPPREEISVESYKFRVAVVDFADQTGRAGDLSKTIPDILATMIFKLKRVDIYDRSTLRGLPSDETDILIKDLLEKRVIDGVIAGTVTRFTGTQKSLVVEMRLLSRNNAVMYANDRTVTFRGRRVMEVNRGDVAAIATAISSSIPTVSDAPVASKVSDHVVIEHGAKTGVIVGMTGYIQARRDTVNDPETGAVATPAYVTVAEIVIDQVNRDTSTGRIVAGRDVRVNDIVRFK